MTMAEATKTINLGIVGAGGMGKTHSSAAASLGDKARVDGDR
jgi:predicted dehydrogenase